MRAGASGLFPLPSREEKILQNLRSLQLCFSDHGSQVLAAAAAVVVVLGENQDHATAKAAAVVVDSDLLEEKEKFLFICCQRWMLSRKIKNCQHFNTGLAFSSFFKDFFFHRPARTQTRSNHANKEVAGSKSQHDARRSVLTLASIHKQPRSSMGPKSFLQLWKSPSFKIVSTYSIFLRRKRISTFDRNNDGRPRLMPRPEGG